jgi:regulator of sigma E protease
MATLISIIAFVLILGILVFVHELGHFAVAKWTGMRVDEFGIGFPPTIWKRKKGETLYKLNIIPFGGYVKIHGENAEDNDDDPRSFDHKSVWARLAVIVAGVTMNVIFAFVVLVIAFSVGFVSFSQDLTKVPGAQVKESQVVVVQALQGSPAEKAGLLGGDIIETFTDTQTGELKEVKTVEELVSYTKAEQAIGHLALTVAYNRDGEEKQTPLTLNAEGYPLGISTQPFSTVRIPFWEAPQAAIHEIGFIFSLTWDALRTFAHKLFFNAQLDPNVSGPVGIYQATSSATSAGVIPTIFLLVALSLNLALLNILPIPALDGGKFLFLLIELIFGKRVIKRHFEQALTFASFVILIGLIVILSVRDVVRLF